MDDGHAKRVSEEIRVTSGHEAYHFGMSRIYSECGDADPPDRLMAAYAYLLRQEPEEEDEGNGKENDDDDNESDEGYSE